MSDPKGIRYYRDLQVWQKAIQLAKSIYRISVSFPSEEKYGLVSQIRRTAVSVPSNIAEGQARNTTVEFICSCLTLEVLWQKSTRSVFWRQSFNFVRFRGLTRYLSKFLS